MWYGPTTLVLLGWPLGAAAVFKQVGIWLPKSVVIAKEGMGPSQGLISAAWEITNIDNLEEMERSKMAFDNVREMVDLVLSMQWDGWSIERTFDCANLYSMRMV